MNIKQLQNKITDFCGGRRAYTVVDIFADTPRTKNEVAKDETIASLERMQKMLDEHREFLASLEISEDLALLELRQAISIAYSLTVLGK